MTRHCTEAARSCATSSLACSSVLNGTSTAPIRVSAKASRTHSHSVRHHQSDAGSLADAGLDERRGKLARGGVELARR